jgi:serine/threonine protein kinase
MIKDSMSTSLEFMDLIEKMLHINKDERIAIEQLVDHPFLTKKKLTYLVQLIPEGLPNGIPMNTNNNKGTQELNRVLKKRGVASSFH